MAQSLAYYNYDKLFSYNAVFNFLVGGRGLGKTYGAKFKAIKAALDKGDQFIYLRRYKTEMRAKDTFFADIFHMFPNHDLRVNGWEAQAAPVQSRNDGKQRQWQTIGYFIALSTAQNQKSIAFPMVKTIIFDEFIIEKGAVRYLPDEAIVFQNFFLTVDRYKDKTRVLFLANSVSIMNPYFLHYDIKPEPETEFIRKGDGFILCHFPDGEAFKEGVSQTRFGKFIKDTEYAAYAMDNNFADNHGNLIAPKPSEAKYFFTIETKSGTFSVWVENRNYYVQEKRPQHEFLYTTVPEKMSDDKKLLVYSDQMMALMRNSFRSGRTWFDTSKSRNAFIEIFAR